MGGVNAIKEKNIKLILTHQIVAELGRIGKASERRPNQNTVVALQHLQRGSLDAAIHVRDVERQTLGVDLSHHILTTLGRIGSANQRVFRNARHSETKLNPKESLVL